MINDVRIYSSDSPEKVGLTVVDFIGGLNVYCFVRMQIYND